MSKPRKNSQKGFPPHEDCTLNEAAAPDRLALTLDIQDYLGELEDWDISESQKREFIVTFWNLLVTFAEVAYGIHPAQTAAATGRKPAQKPAKDPAAKTAKNGDFSGFLDTDMLHSNLKYRTQIIEPPEAICASEESENPS